MQSTLTGAHFYRTDWHPTVCVWLGKEALYIFSLTESRLKTKSGGFDRQKLQSRSWWYRGFGYFETDIKWLLSRPVETYETLSQNMSRLIYLYSGTYIPIYLLKPNLYHIETFSTCQDWLDIGFGKEFRVSRLDSVATSMPSENWKVNVRTTSHK